MSAHESTNAATHVGTADFVWPPRTATDHIRSALRKLEPVCSLSAHTSMTTGLLCPLGSTPNHSPQIPSTRRLQYNNSHGNDRWCPSSYSHGSCLLHRRLKPSVWCHELLPDELPQPQSRHSHVTATLQPRLTPSVRRSHSSQASPSEFLLGPSK